MDNDQDKEKEDKGEKEQSLEIGARTSGIIEKFEEEQSLKIGTPTPETIGKFKDVLVSQEDTRAFLARFLVFIFAGAVLLTFVYIFLLSFFPASLECGMVEGKTICNSDGEGKDLITLLLSSLTAVIGTALGFYFGSSRGSRS
jgi:hypothetical protein